MDEFMFDLGDSAKIACSGETGKIVSRSQSIDAQPQYLLRYKAGDGRAVETWWAQDALQTV
jgi:hypothetical protein